jgi:hypothetical protein
MLQASTYFTTSRPMHRDRFLHRSFCIARCLFLLWVWLRACASRSGSAVFWTDESARRSVLGYRFATV